ncbi:hypothetical protein [Edaphobacter dinghuensis]|uniref:Uncharacterized protein n=1 Tax=Edaphobacter dinghuensis TaxID=1560005 RepID=A0A917HNA4_9BACT|nr:hypothetical protein [Edaphobacter dinghuensis]GGG84861.1 hypothetical protein GCM10011585_30840 [Edaphobacter dinghuensis]
MTAAPSLSDIYLHIRVIISIIVGLCITTLLSGFARFVQHPRRERPSILHLGWAASLLLWVTHFWWWEFRLASIRSWNFETYLFVIFYAILYFLLSKLLFPDDISEYGGYEQYFLSRRRWFFALLAGTLVFDYIDTALKGTAYLHSFGIEYPIRLAINLAFCIIGLISPNRRIQLTVLTLTIAYQITFIILYYNVQ